MGKTTSMDSDRDWDAANDARSLMEAVSIQSDAARLKRAKKALSKLEKEAERAKLERNVAKGLKKLNETIDKG